MLQAVNLENRDLEKKIAEAEAVLEELRSELREQRKIERPLVIERVRELVANYQLTASDLGLVAIISGKNNNTKTAIKVPGVSVDKRYAVAPKYRDPDTGATWTGRGKVPVWMSEKISAGATKEQFAIET